MRLRRLLVLLAATLLLVSGCGGDNPKPKPMPKPSSTTSASSSPAPPAMPEAAKKKSKKGAIAFVRHYVDVLNYATFSGSTGPARELSSRGCESCQRMLGALDRIYAAGGSVKGGAWKVRVLSDVPHPGGRGWTVDGKVTYGPQTVTEKKGAEAKHYSGGGRLVSFILTSRKGTWIVDDWTRS